MRHRSERRWCSNVKRPIFLGNGELATSISRAASDIFMLEGIRPPLSLPARLKALLFRPPGDS